VQISASGSEAGAQADLAAVRRRFGKAVAGRDLRVEKADVRGQTVYRAVVAGFASPAEAQRTCEALKALGQGCFVRGR
jgi:hypothetical protein